MLLDRVAELLECDVLLGAERLATVQVSTCFAADLMSDVLRFSRSGTLLLTGLTSVQSVHTADVADLPAILFVAGKRPPQPTLDLAREKGLPVLVTRHGMYEACGLLHAAGLVAAE